MNKIPNFENSIWRTAAILKMVYRYISAENNPILMKFGVQTQTLVQGRSHANLKKNMKFKMADSRHIENRILAISPRVSYCPIDAIFGRCK